MKKGVVRCLAASLSLLLPLEPLSASVNCTPLVGRTVSSVCTREAMSHAGVHFIFPMEESPIKSKTYRAQSSWIRRSPSRRTVSYTVLSIGTMVGLYLNPSLLPWIGTGLAFAIMSAHIPPPTIGYKSALLKELDQLRRSQLPWNEAEISADIYHATMDMIRSAA